MVWLRRSPKTRNCQREAAPITKCLLLLFYCVVSRVAISLTSWSSSHSPLSPHFARQPTRRSFTNAIADSLFRRHSHTAPTMQINYYYFRAPRPPFDAYEHMSVGALQFDAVDGKVLFYYVFAKSSHSSQTTVCTIASMSALRSIN